MVNLLIQIPILNVLRKNPLSLSKKEEKERENSNEIN